MRIIDADVLWMDIIHSMDYCDDILEIIERQPTVQPEASETKTVSDGEIRGNVIRAVLRKISANDTISRQDAIDMVYGCEDEFGKDVVFRFADYIRQLPSTEPEVIHCKDCKYSKHWYRDKSRCFLWHESGIDVFDDGFCNYAKEEESK